MLKDINDISDNYIKENLVPMDKNFNQYMIEFVIPEVFAFQLSNSYYRNCLCDATFEQHYHSLCDVFNGFNNDFKKIIDLTISILLIKYNLKITNEIPLILKKRQ